MLSREELEAIKARHANYAKGDSARARRQSIIDFRNNAGIDIADLIAEVERQWAIRDANEKLTRQVSEIARQPVLPPRNLVPARGAFPAGHVHIAPESLRFVESEVARAVDFYYPEVKPDRVMGMIALKVKTRGDVCVQIGMKDFGNKRIEDHRMRVVARVTGPGRRVEVDALLDDAVEVILAALRDAIKDAA
jgi:hypothetical protein